MAANVRRIEIHEARPNMILARDISTDSGLVLMGENTLLNDRSIQKLKVYDIDSIYIKEFDPDDIIESEILDGEKSIKNSSSSVTDTKEFIEFSENFKLTEEKAKLCLDKISSGSDSDVAEIYTITTNVISSLPTKNSLFSFIHHLKEFDNFTYSHSIKVSMLSNLFGFWLKLKPESIINLTVAGMLHDIGKTMVDPSILNKRGKLTSNEFEEMKKHCIYGYRMLEKQDLPNEVKKAALMHHERLDGSGYPMGAKDEQIDDFSKIIAIVDVYDALTSERPFRGKFTPFDVIKEFETVYFGKLDTKYLLDFLQNIAYNYIGSRVLLSTDEEAEVVFINSNSLSSPIVKTNSNKFLDLSTHSKISITEFI